MTLFARISHNGAATHAIVDGDRLRLLSGDLFGDHKETGETVALDPTALMSPVNPSKILAAAVNYPSHVPSAKAVLDKEEAPAIPQLFLKPPSSVIGPEETIVLPAEARRVDAEGELVAVIGRRCSRVSAGEALNYVVGYTCGNDISARHWQRDDIQWWRAKGSDTFAPIGPFIATGLDPTKLELRTRLNGEVAQEANTGTLIHSTAELVAFASQVMTLEPGDLVFTGTPGVTPKLEDGDVVEVEIEGVGLLRNPVSRYGGGQA
jgi:2-keto-4-pentenoate hydratase/2-oxohepta-3-ene-1,7-dioic acid hydratase in catechol pathway